MPDTRTLKNPWARLAVRAVVAGAVGLVVHDAVKLSRIRRVADAAGVLDHDALVGDGLGEPLRLVVLGDSAAAGHGISDAADAMPQRIGVQLAKATGRRVEARSFAVSGATTGDVRRFQAPRLRDGSADVVVLNVGVNDALARRIPSDLDDQTVALVEVVRDHVPAAHVVFVEAPDLSNAPGIPWATGRFVGRRCRRVRDMQRAVVPGTGVPLVELPDRLDPDGFGLDGFHPGPAGQDAIAELVVGRIVTT